MAETQRLFILAKQDEDALLLWSEMVQPTKVRVWGKRTA